MPRKQHSYQHAEAGHEYPHHEDIEILYDHVVHIFKSAVYELVKQHHTVLLRVHIQVASRQELIVYTVACILRYLQHPPLVELRVEPRLMHIQGKEHQHCRSRYDDHSPGYSHLPFFQYDAYSGERPQHHHMEPGTVSHVEYRVHSGHMSGAHKREQQQHSGYSRHDAGKDPAQHFVYLIFHPSLPDIRSVSP